MKISIFKQFFAAAKTPFAVSGSSPAPSVRADQYRAEIDGLRALAVLPVILFHAELALFSGGYVGVDVFFVISGYLIAGILIRDLEAERFSLLTFYERRARRILPALFTVMLACMPAAWILMRPAELREFLESVAATSLFGSNILFWLETDYFGAAAETKPLLHTWSLAVEEQYYLFFPLLLALLYRFGRGVVAWALLGVAVASFVAAEVTSHTAPAAAFFLVHTRVWELLAGALIALLAHRRAIPGSDRLAIPGLVLVLLPVFVLDDATRFPGIAAVPSVLGAGLIIAFATKGTVAARVLSNRALTWVGLVSYSAYLWHWPLLAFGKYTDLPGWGVFPLILGTFALAFLTWRFVEQPFRRRGSNALVSRRSVFAGTGAGIFASLLVAWAGNETDGFNDYYMKHRVTGEQAVRAELIFRHTDYDLRDVMVDDGGCVFWADALEPAVLERFDACARRHGTGYVVLGDSHAMNIHNILAKAGVGPFLVGLARPGCRPHDTATGCHYSDALAVLGARKQHVAQLIYHQSGSYFLRDPQGRVDSPRAFEEDAPLDIDVENIDEVIGYLEALRADLPVLWLGPFTEARVELWEADTILSPLRLNPVTIPRFEALDARLAELTSKHDLPYVSLVDALALEEHHLVVGDCLTFRDQDHFSQCGEDWVAERLMGTLPRILGESATN